MRLHIEDKNKRILYLSEREMFVCSVCGVDDSRGEVIRFCEQNNKLYCHKCIIDGRACDSVYGHDDFKIDEVRADE